MKGRIRVLKPTPTCDRVCSFGDNPARLTGRKNPIAVCRVGIEFDSGKNLRVCAKPGTYCWAVRALYHDPACSTPASDSKRCHRAPPTLTVPRF